MIERWWLLPFDQGTVEASHPPTHTFICFFIQVPWKQLGSLLIRNTDWSTWVGLVSPSASVSPTEKCCLQWCRLCNPLCASESREWLVVTGLA